MTTDFDRTGRANDEIAYWNGTAGARWAREYTVIDRLFAPFSAALLARAAPRDGESVVDVGCGVGATTLALAERVGTTGRVTGVDVSAPLIAVAQQRARDARCANATFLCADAAQHPFTPDADLVTSRFGVMFFADPVAAFANIRRALHADGRLAFACWRSLAENSWFAVPRAAAEAHLAPQPPRDPHDPGPLAFADPAYVESVLTKAGYSDIALAPVEADLSLGAQQTAVDFVTRIGPVSSMLSADGVTDAQRAAVAASIADAFAPHSAPDGVTLGGAVWIVSAQR